MSNKRRQTQIETSDTNRDVRHKSRRQTQIETSDTNRDARHKSRRQTQIETSDTQIETSDTNRDVGHKSRRQTHQSRRQTHKSRRQTHKSRRRTHKSHKSEMSDTNRGCIGIAWCGTNRDGTRRRHTVQSRCVSGISPPATHRVHTIPNSARRHTMHTLSRLCLTSDGLAAARDSTLGRVDVVRKGCLRAAGRRS
jgi:hypothetical protein